MSTTCHMVIKRGSTILAEIQGTKDVAHLPLDTITKIIDTELFLDQLLGVRVHITMKEETK